MRKTNKEEKVNYTSEPLLYLFNQGKHYNLYKMLGAHKERREGKKGYRFAVWAPEASAVSVVCDSNGWNKDANPMELHENHGVWETFIEGIDTGEVYKYLITTRNGQELYKADPMAFASQLRPETASVTADLSYEWNDSDWLLKREKTEPYNKPLNIYEMHFGSWKTHEDGSFLTYREMAEELIPYVKKQGYTHIELMPLAEYPFDGSWGYQVTGYYSATSRFGSGEDLKYFIDKCHKAGIGVIMDWVPAHFPKDAHGLSRFDGSCLYEHPDSRRGEHKEWGTLVFDWTKTEIHSFLISNAIFWLEEYHFDGLRVDAVSSMLYLDYNRGWDWLPNKFGGKENLEAIEFLQSLNKAVFERFPNVLMIAEESTAWGGVTKPVHEGGLGFNFKWNMGWMNDILRYMAMDPYFRGSNHNLITFSMMYAYSENYILPLSHDEVVHGKKSLIDKMYGDYEQKFKSLRLLYSFMFAHPGKKMLFMGGEFGQFIEWRFAEGLDWLLLDYDRHAQMKDFTKDLNKFYSSHKSFYENDSDWDGFKWINAGDSEHSTISFMRISRSRREKIIAVLNFAAKDHKEYYIGVPSAGEYEVIFTTDDIKYGGEGKIKGPFKAEKGKTGDFDYYIKADLPALSSMYLKKSAKSRKA
ncbi:MAG: 1,4-alpha-glucan branching protein GlgB [Clostridia bacterium]|nr:1,4-alpha-glucan branching protein GlgB [Clostridia bacterium]